jgi:aminoglycoside 3-N-acetyltransferase
MENGERIWVERPDMANDDGVHFPVVGSQFVAASTIKRGNIGEADSMLFSTRALVDFAESYFARELGA